MPGGRATCAVAVWNAQDDHRPCAYTKGAMSLSTSSAVGMFVRVNWTMVALGLGALAMVALFLWVAVRQP